MGHYQEVSITRSYTDTPPHIIKTNYGLIHIKCNRRGHDPNTGQSATGERETETERERQREIKYSCKIVEIRIMEAILNMTLRACSFQN